MKKQFHLWQVAQPTAYQLKMVGKFVRENIDLIYAVGDIWAMAFQLGCGVPISPQQLVSLIGDVKTIAEYLTKD